MTVYPVKDETNPFNHCRCGLSQRAGQTFDQLALTPQMGWNSWNKFADKVNEQLIRDTADAMVPSGAVAILSDKTGPHRYRTLSAEKHRHNR